MRRGIREGVGWELKAERMVEQSMICCIDKLFVSSVFENEDTMCILFA